MNTRPKIGAFKVGSTKPQQVLVENCNRKAVLIYNNGTANIELLSSPQQKYGDGIPIVPKVPYSNQDYCQGAYWLIAESGDQDVRIEEDVKV